MCILNDITLHIIHCHYTHFSYVSIQYYKLDMCILMYVYTYVYVY